MKNLAVIFLMACFAFGFSSCGNDDDTDQTELPIINELPYYSVKFEESIAESEGMETSVHVINSEEEMITLLGDEFLENYPQYTTIDYSLHSAIIATTKLNSDINDIKFRFLRCYDTQIPIYYRLQLSYNMDQNIISDHFIVIFGVLVDKLSNDTIVLLC